MHSLFVCIAYKLAYGLSVGIGVCVRSVWTGVSFVCAQVECARSVKFVCFFKSQKVSNGFVEHFGMGFSRVLDARGHAKA